MKKIRDYFKNPFIVGVVFALVYILYRLIPVWSVTDDFFTFNNVMSILACFIVPCGIGFLIYIPFKIKKIRNYSKNPFIVIIVIALVYGLYRTMYLWYLTNDFFTLNNLISILSSVIVPLSIGFFGIKLFKGYSERPPEEQKKRFIPTILLFFLGTIVITFLITFIFLPLFSHIIYAVPFLFNAIDKENIIFPDFVELLGPFHFELIFSHSNFLILFIILPLFLLYNLWTQSINKEKKLQEENLKYKYRTLKTQINPHFLFNSLNTLSEIVYIDAKKADNYTQKLAGVYRFILDNEDVDLLPLTKELEFVKEYFSLQKERNEDKIVLNINIDNPQNYKIIPISLQILIENALKHNSASKEQPLTIDVFIEEGFIIVKNNLQKKTILDNSSGTGLANLKERAKLIMNKEMIIVQDNNQFVVKLPVISIL
ncbi:two-component system LytT family sensor kinase [Dysgonomonadaceae bacterium PH5-43]|nr:two-component system LytT family sensor kinase [Dysgonomonadaceae bacterium PH5-43]